MRGLPTGAPSGASATSGTASPSRAGATTGTAAPSRASATTGTGAPSPDSATSGPRPPSRASATSGTAAPSPARATPGPRTPSRASATSGTVAPSPDSATSGPRTPSRAGATTGTGAPSPARATAGAGAPSTASTARRPATGSRRRRDERSIAPAPSTPERASSASRRTEAEAKTATETGAAVAPRRRGRPRTGGKREQILDAALELFATRGFHGTAIPDLAARAGVAAGTIYSHFVGKEDVVNVLYRRTKRRMIDGVLAGLPGAGSVRQQFHQLWRRLRAFERASPVAFAFLELHHHADYLDHDSRALEVEALLPVARFLEGAARAGQVRAILPAALMALVWGGFVGLVKAERTGYLHLTDDLSAQVEATLWDAIRARTQPHEEIDA